MVVERFALLTVVADSVVLAVITDAAANASGCFVDSRVEMAFRRMFVTLTFWVINILGFHKYYTLSNL